MSRLQCGFSVTLAQHGDAVADGHYLVQLVGDEDNRIPLGSHTVQDSEQVLGLPWREHGSGLIQDQDVGAAI